MKLNLSSLLSFLAFCSIGGVMWLSLLGVVSIINPNVFFSVLIFLVIGTFAGANAVEKKDKR